MVKNNSSLCSNSSESTRPQESAEKRRQRKDDAEDRLKRGPTTERIMGQKHQLNRVLNKPGTPPLGLSAAFGRGLCEKRRVSVALIDDDVCQRKFLMAQFAKLGAAVTPFASGLDFLSKGCSAQEKQICWYLRPHHAVAFVVAIA